MALVALSKQDDYDLTNSDQDCRGWTVTDTDGNPLGKVTDMIVDTEAEHVDSIVLDSGAQVPAANIALRNGKVLVRGAAAGGTGTAAAMRETTTTTTTTATNERASSNAAMAADTSAAAARNTSGEIALPVIEERIMVGKRAVQSGGVRVSQHVTERPVEETVTLREETVHVDRRPVNQAIDPSQIDAFKEGTIEITETAEEAVVAKQARVVEEVVVGKEATERTETIRDTVRRTDVEVEQINADTTKRRNQ